jgi:hypothetical protein
MKIALPLHAPAVGDAFPVLAPKRNDREFQTFTKMARIFFV